MSLFTLPPNHPLWAIVHTVVQAGAVTFVFGVCAYITANSFDTNELQMLAGGGAIVGIGNLVSKFLKG